MGVIPNGEFGHNNIDNKKLPMIRIDNYNNNDNILTTRTFKQKKW